MPRGVNMIIWSLDNSFVLATIIMDNLLYNQQIIHFFVYLSILNW